MKYIEPTLLLQLAVSLLFGAIIGFEREYRSKAAGFRTITIITLGSTLFTIISLKLGVSPNQDRLAANVITGIGFIGAGVIFKDNFSVSGLTTAATIWVSAAIGMALGIGEYIIASFTLVLSLVVLALFEKLQTRIDDVHRVQLYKISYHLDYVKVKEAVEEHMALLKVSYRVVKCLRGSDDVTLYYSVAGGHEQLSKLTEYLLSYRDVKAFEE